MIPAAGSRPPSRFETGYNRVGELADAVASHGSATAKVDYVKALAGETTGKGLSGSLGTSWSRAVDAEAGAVGKVIGSMRGAQAEAALGSLDQQQLNAVLKTGIDETSFYSQGGVATSFDAKDFQSVMDAAASTGNADLKARVFDAAADSLREVRDTQGVGIGIGQNSPDRGPTLNAVRDSITKLLDSDTGGVTRELTYNTEMQDGSDLAAYSQVMIATGQEAKLGAQMAKLQFGNDLKGDPIGRLNRTVDVNGQERRENAGALGVGDPVADAYNTTLSRVQRTAQP